MPHNRKISVVGLGYVGLPVAVAFGRQSKVIGFDVNVGRISELKEGIDKTNEVSSDDLKKTDILFTTDVDDLEQADFHIIAVPTPINDAKQPDLTALKAVSKTLGSQLKKGDIVVYESTVYPGATEEECIPILEATSGLKSDNDFSVGYSPERINPGDKQHTFSSITKVVSAQNEETLKTVADVYGAVVTAGIHRTPSIKVAEAAKVIENTQRDLNIALMNELALIFDRFGIDSGDVLTAACTKWNFLPFKPGLVGGHCIGVDPYYLTHKAAISGYIPQVILSGRSINDGMGKFIVSRVIKALIKGGFSVKANGVTILGFTFKEDVPDTRNTRVIDIINELQDFEMDVQIHDPQASKEEVKNEYGLELKTSAQLTPGCAVILAVPHHEYSSSGWDLIKGLLKDNKGVVFDVGGVLNRATIPEGVQLERL